MSRISPTFGITIVPPGLSALGTAATALSSGQSATFTIPGLDLSTTAGAVTSMQTFAGYLVWDSTQKKMHMVGTAHTGGIDVAGAGGWASYDEATNTFSKELYSWRAPGWSGHAGDGRTVNPATGTIYAHPYNSSSAPVYRKLNGASGQGSWTTGFIAGATTGNTGTIMPILEWFGEANGGAGGLVSRDYTKWYVSNSGVTAWASTLTGIEIAYGSNSTYWGCRANGQIHFGVMQDHIALNSNVTEVSLVGPPVVCGNTENFSKGLVVPHPNGTDLLCFEINSGTKRVWRYDAAGNTWNSGSPIGTHAFNNGNGGSPFLCIATIPSYSVVMGWEHTQFGSTVCRLFKVP